MKDDHYWTLCMNRHFALLVLFLCSGTMGAAQELDCKFTIETTSLTPEAKANLEDFEAQVTRYMNNYQWTNEDFKGGKIPCAFRIVILNSPSDNTYSAQLFVGSQRPMYKLDRNTAVMRILDDKWNFGYIKYESMNHDESRFDPLMSLLDFYAYVILGYDFDTYKAGDGTQFFQKAGEILNRARNSSSGSGWDLPTRASYTRAGLIDELVTPKFYDLREASFKYHYRGLDLLHKDEVKARKNIFAALQKIATLQQRINQNSLTIRLFFEAKYLEICDIFLKDPDLTIYTQLSRIDPAHQKNYEEYSRKPR